MRKSLYFSIIIALTSLLYSCDGTNSGEDTLDGSNPETLVKAEGGRFYGGILKVNSLDNYSSLFPASMADVYSQHISSQVYEGLLKFNQKTLELEPCIAETYEIDPTNRFYTFKIRKGLMFHDDECFTDGKGREITSDDLKYVFEFLCSNHALNKSQYLVKDYIKGGDEYANGTAKSVSGIKAIDKYTFQIELKEPFAGFTNVLALTQTAIFPKEALDKYGDDIKDKAIGSGPYIFESIGEEIILNKNKNYWKQDEFGNQLPYISQVKIIFESSKTKELEIFNNGDLDFVWGVPVVEIPNIMGTLDEAKEGKNREFILQSINGLQTQYYGFLLTHETFNNKKVRQAFNYAINRDTIVNFVLQGEGDIANNGIIPKMSGYPSETVNGYAYNPSKAKKLMAEAGYPGGKGFPTVELSYNKVGDINELVANTIKQQLFDVLGVNVNFNEFTTKEINEKREQGELSFWRYGWIADFPGPSNFIGQFHSKYIKEGSTSSINHGRYKNAEFDKLIDLAMAEPDEEKRMVLFAQAEQILIDDAAVIPIYYGSEIRLINPQLKNFPINEIEFRDYSVCYFVEKKEESKVRVYDNIVGKEE